MMVNYVTLIISIFQFAVSSNNAVRKYVRRLSPIKCDYYRIANQDDNSLSISNKYQDRCRIKDKVNEKTVISSIELIGLTDEQKKDLDIVSAETTLTFYNSFIFKKSIKVSNETNVKVFKKRVFEKRGLSSNSRHFGKKQVLVLRVKTPDEQTKAHEAQIAKDVFGLNKDGNVIENFKQVTLTSQYSDCSYTQLTFSPFMGTTETGIDISNGVGTVHISSSVQERDRHDVEDDVISAAHDKYGSLQSQFDHILLCLPYGTTRDDTDKHWGGYADLPGHLTVFNEERCQLPHYFMHEMGHNLGLEHSNFHHKEYADGTGYMGQGDRSVHKMCFNGPKSWQLGWYTNTYLSIDPTKKKKDVEIVGVVHYDDNSDYKTILRLTHSQHDKYYYIAFNRKVGMNTDTQTGPDKVHITSKSNESSKEYSDLLKVLDKGEHHILLNYTPDRHVIITVNEILLYHKPSYAQISIDSFASTDGMDCQTNDDCNFYCDPDTNKCSGLNV